VKKIILTLFCLTTLTSFSQNKRNKSIDIADPKWPRVKEFIVPYVGLINTCGLKIDTNFNKKMVLIEIAHLLDSIREYIYEKDLMVTEIDSLGNKACEHHCKYLKNMVSDENPNVGVTTHDERINLDFNFKYVGKDTLIDNPTDRHDFFAKKDPMNYTSISGEVCMVGPLSSLLYLGLNPKDIARNIIFDFYSSKPHWKALTSHFYHMISADIQFKKQPDGQYTFWFTLCTINKYVKTIRVVKNKMYYPGNPLGFTEYFDVIDTELIGNW